MVILFIVTIYFGDNDVKFSFYMHLFLFFKTVGPLKEVAAYLNNNGMAKFIRVILTVLRDKKAGPLYVPGG